jgi:Clp amino terminal domain, pathogenicity island component
MKAENLYRILLRAYPSRYRREYEEAMAQCFRDQWRAANTTGKRVRLWLRIFGDLAATIPLQHWAGGRFEGYTRDAKRAIFFARYEAVSFGGPEITLDHLLLGVLRDNKELAAAVEARQTNPRRRPVLQVHAGRIPLGPDCKKALAEASRLARASGTKVTPRHFLSAILAQRMQDTEDTSEAARLLRGFIHNGEF